MAKYYYECVHQVDMAYMAPWGKGGSHAENPDDENAPLLVRHWIRVRPSRGYDGRGRRFPPDYIVTEKPLARHFLEQMVKKVSRVAFDPDTGRKLPARAYRKKVTKIKFKKVPQEEMYREIAENAIRKPWADELFEDVPLKVELPKDPELERLKDIMGPDEEPETDNDTIQPEGQPKRGRPPKDKKDAVS